MLLLGDCNHWLKEIKDESIDLIVTDPPYGIEFMGKDWDKALVSTETWKECFRVLKQGKLAFVMCSPRQDVLSRMIVNLQDAGFRTNYTSIYWTFASGFPKAANISKLIDKKNGRDFNPELRAYLNRQRIQKGLTFKDINEHLGYSVKGGNFASDLLGDKKDNRYLLPDVQTYNKLKSLLELDNRYDEFIAIEAAQREVLEKRRVQRNSSSWEAGGMLGVGEQNFDITKPATEEAKKMEGAYVGFQPKPAVEIILVVSKGKTLTWLDDCRIPYQSEDDKAGWFSSENQGIDYRQWGINHGYRKNRNEEPEHKNQNEKGRFPANLICSDDVLNDGKISKSGTFRQSFRTRGLKTGKFMGEAGVGEYGVCSGTDNYGDSGSYSRYFSLDAWAKTFPFLIVPKASAAERNKGCEDLPLKEMEHSTLDTCKKCGKTLVGTMGSFCKCDVPERQHFKARNHHPTVKPLKLMSYLITMGSREGDLVLDPFCGSGTVCIAAHQLHRKWLGIEMNPEYAEIIKKRLADPLAQLKLTSYLENKQPRLP